MDRMRRQRDPHGVARMTTSASSVHSARAALRAGIRAAALTSGLMALSGAACADDMTLTKTGSTLLYPLFGVWVSEYTKTHPGVHITTGNTGSEEASNRLFPARYTSAPRTPT
jgi:ABC-type phosphate transport system substrate-binding protein